VRNGFFRKDEFRYDPDQMCTSVRPEKRYRRTTKASSGLRESIQHPAACPAVLFGRGAPQTVAGFASGNEAVLDRMALA